MKSLLYCLVLCFPAMVFGQKINEVDSLLLNASYTKALEMTTALAANTSDANHKMLLQNKTAEALIFLGRFYEAEQTLSAISGAADPFQKGMVMTNFGLLYMNQGRHDLAQQSLLKAVTEFEASQKETSLECAQAITYLGLVYNATGNYAKAQEQLMMALGLRQRILNDRHELIAASYNDLGLAYANTDYDRALDYYEKAFKIYASIHGPEHPKLAIASINNGLIYRKLELYGDAVNNFESALKIWDKVYKGSHPTKAFALMNLGETYMKMQNYESANGYYLRSLKMFRESYGEKHPDISQVLNVLGNIALSGNKYEQALNYYQQAVIANTNGFEDMNQSSLPALGGYYNGHVLLYSLLYRAQALEKRYLGKSLKLSDLTTSLRTLQYCDSLIDKLRQHSTNESDKIALGVIANEVYADGVRIATETAFNSVRKKPYLELAFYFAEKSKSAVLLESISDANAKSFAGIPPSLMEEEKNFKSAISLTNQMLSQKPDPEQEKYLRETIYTLSRSYEGFIKKLEHDFPQYFNLKFNAASPSMQELQKLLNDNTAVLSYFVDEKQARLYTFLITSNKYKVFEKALPKEFDKYITGFRNSIYYNELKAFKLTGSKLGALLIPSGIPRKINELVILPTGRMSVIPFEALLTGKKVDGKTFKDLRFLIHHYAVRYEFSASLLLQKTKGKRKLASPSIFLCAPVTFPGGEKLPELPGTESEVKEISKLFTDKNLTASVNLREEANESLIKQNGITGYSLVHLATHGIVDEYRPELSRIFLQTTANAEDGSLFSGEIYNLNLNADLVTLSACQTGLGKISKGEGVIGLSRALVYAGAKNIIVSYWSVSDESTAELMKDFYRQLLESSYNSYNSSLREAKLHLIESSNYSAPYYWAPFILIGF
jgi:CHAT domain-containing protein/Tfp pilus assembly protein PilF